MFTIRQPKQMTQRELIRAAVGCLLSIEHGSIEQRMDSRPRAAMNQREHEHGRHR